MGEEKPKMTYGKKISFVLIIAGIIFILFGILLIEYAVLLAGAVGIPLIASGVAGYVIVHATSKELPVKKSESSTSKEELVFWILGSIISGFIAALLYIFILEKSLPPSASYSIAMGIFFGSFFLMLLVGHGIRRLGQK